MLSFHVISRRSKQEIVIDIKAKLQESKDERRTRLDENNIYRE